MNTYNTYLCSFLIALTLIATCSYAADAPAAPATPEAALDRLQKTLQEMETRHQQEMEALRRQIAEQRAAIEKLQTSAPAAPAAPSVAATPPPTPPRRAWSPSDPIRVAGNAQNYMNISFDGLFTAAATTAPRPGDFEMGGHDPSQRGFNVQGLETVFDGAVDPYFKGQANFVSQITDSGETTFEAEEAWLQTSSLPGNLQAKGGLFLSPFGHINQQHAHAWDFVNQSIVNGRFLGGDGLRNPGAQLSWLAPLPWFSEITLAIQNGIGGTAYSFRNRGDGDTFMGRPTLDRNLRGFGDLLYVPRWENSFDLTDEQTIVLGTSAALGPNDTGPNARTEIYGTDLIWKWKPSNSSGGFPFVKWQSEAMLRRFEAGAADPLPGVVDPLPDEVFRDWGAYSQVVWGFSKGWTAGLRGEYLHMEVSPFSTDATRQQRWRISPNLTWYLSEFSKLRIQWDHDEIASAPGIDSRRADAVFLQFEFLLGAHGAHKF